MKVMKFGGSSVANAEMIAQVQTIVQAEITNSNAYPIVVVSACFGITNLLAEAAQYAASGDEVFRKKTREVEIFHLALSKELLPDSEYVQSALYISLQIRELEKVLFGVFLLKELTPRVNDLILAFGERLSASVITRYFCSNNLPATLSNAAEYLITDLHHGNARVDESLSREKTLNAFSDPLKLPVVTGFTGVTPTGEITTLGRGGSDYTAAILASLLQTKSLEIWTDVNGFYTADPARVTGASTIPLLTYMQAYAITRTGAKVLYPPTIEPAYKLGLPIAVKCTALPNELGTLIEGCNDTKQSQVLAVSAFADVVLVNIVAERHGVTERSIREINRILYDADVSVILSFPAPEYGSVTVCVHKSDTAVIKSIFALHSLHHPGGGFSVSVKERLCVVSLITGGNSTSCELQSKVFGLLAVNNIHSYGAEYSSYSCCFSVIIDSENEYSALNILHDACIAEKKTIISKSLIADTANDTVPGYGVTQRR